MNLEELDALVLREIAKRMRAIERRPKPPSWQTIAVADDEELREYGPRYSPKWFGDVTDAHRQRLLRTIHRLGRRGLAWVTQPEGCDRLQHVRLTEAGLAAAKAKGPKDKPKVISEGADGQTR